MKPCSPTELPLPNQSKTSKCRCNRAWIWWRTLSHKALVGSWVDLINEARELLGQALTSHHTVWTNQWTKATMDLFSTLWCSSNNRWMGSLLKTITTPSRWRSNLLVCKMLMQTTTSSRTQCSQQSRNWILQLAQAATIDLPIPPNSPIHHSPPECIKQTPSQYSMLATHTRTHITEKMF